MPLGLTWHEIALRLGLSVLAGGVIGFDRSERGRQAGVRTMLLVCLAAAIAMLQANLLMGTVGKAANSFVVLDLMRLPLGILTGMGFIGGGVILRREGLVIGVTTASTLWFVTVIGLCFGGGQLALGLAGTALAILVLTGLRRFDRHMKRDQNGLLLVETDRDEPRQEEIRALVERAGYKISVASVTYLDHARQRRIEFRLQWRSAPQIVDSPPFLADLMGNPHVISAQWKVI